MKSLEHLAVVGGLGALLAVAAITPEARANVYASNIKFNGNLSSVTNAAGTPVTISFILNEPASLGTTINIVSGASVVDAISIAAGNAGTLKGSNAVVWGGTNSSGGNVAGGTYGVTITPSSSGYTNWTQITTDSNPGNYVYWPAGIAVDCNTNSLYYGRIMVANSGPNDSGTNFGDTNGIIKLNADASFADEGQSTAGYSFDFDGYNGDTPRRGRVGADDRFYFNDWSGNGRIVAVDMPMTTNQVVLDSANFTGPAANGEFPEIDITDAGTTNALAWFADFTQPGVGVWAWPMTNNGAVNPSDTTGTQILAPGGTDIPAKSAYGLMIDERQDIFIGDFQTGSGSTEPRVTCITNWPSSPNQPLTNNNVLWSVGQGDNTFEDVYDLAIDSRANPHYVACALDGGAGGLRILSATNGSLVTNIQQSVSTNFLSVGWDNVGNVYAGSSASLWRAFSPPGTNQATTAAVETIQVIGASVVQPKITSINVSNNIVTIYFTGSTNDAASVFTLLSSGTAIPASGYTSAAGATISSVSPGLFKATVAVNGSIQFYRIMRSANGPLTAPRISSISINGNTVTVNFTGSSSDPASAFTLMSSGTAIPLSSYSAAAGASNSLVSPGVFRTTVPMNGSSQCYRIKR
jgi:hypothetical protein